MIEIDRLNNATGLRCYADYGNMAEAVKQLILQAQQEGLTPHSINIECSEDFLETGDFHIVLWAD